MSASYFDLSISSTSSTNSSPGQLLDKRKCPTMAVDMKYTPEEIVQDKASSSEEGIESIQDGAVKKISRISSIMTVVVSGLALFSDGYNAQIIGYMKPLLKVLYKDGLSDTMSTRLSNSYRMYKRHALYLGHLLTWCVKLLAKYSACCSSDSSLIRSDVVLVSFLLPCSWSLA